MPAQSCNRIDLALEQLELAITLFLDGKSFASVITLASAAERVLGQALRHSGKDAVLDWTFMETAPVHDLLHGVALKKGAYVDTQNRVSNALRHFDDKDAPNFDADLDEAACWMLVRACENAHRLGLTVQGFDAFNDWFYEHVVGI
ncbi:MULTISPECIES: hypothetical protein [Paraburkholderia]|uniref:hypothetical protein n=1 Tax=Paraburkholderia TaxID=1822464 RepID=UPI002250C8E7|nr:MULTISPECIES: hypothetical protein [Paraburkholderia]MCX4176795.1 hypothetical protein [Paraburkholderia madseniana]MDQ6464786.1 hypothetical protein [Paraburkholderia madseniana]